MLNDDFPGWTVLVDARLAVRKNDDAIALQVGPQRFP